MWLGGGDVLRASILPILLLLVLVPAVQRGLEKTLAGELIAAGALAAAACPVAVAGGIALSGAFIIWGVWFAAFTVTTVAVS